MNVNDRSWSPVCRPTPPAKKAQECRQERKGSIATNQILLRAEKKHHVEGWSRQVEVKQWKMVAQTITEKCEAQRFAPSIVEPCFGFTISGSCATSTSFEVVLHGCDSGCFLWRTICLFETFALSKLKAYGSPTFRKWKDTKLQYFEFHHPKSC